MLATRSRLLARLSILPKSPVAPRRLFADQPAAPPTPSATSTPSPPTSAPAAQARVARTGSDYVVPIPQQRGPPKLQNGYSGAFYISLLGGLLIATPIITYMYWEHRDAHMKSKKEAILKDIQTRAGVA